MVEVVDPTWYHWPNGAPGSTISSVTNSVVDAAGGTAALVELARLWHDRCLADPIVGHAFSHGVHPEHCERLGAYWSEALGGPEAYSGSIGDESTVIRMHSGMGVHIEMDEAAVLCFDLALEDAGLSADPKLRTTLSEYFRWATATMSMYPDSPEDVAADLPIAKWSWDGPVPDHRGSLGASPS